MTKEEALARLRNRLGPYGPISGARAGGAGLTVR
jgi:hypothetical protein